jgi:hypothetical protein
VEKDKEGREMKFGFEKEYFLQKAEVEPKVFVEVPPGIPKDECGFLVECRGPACGDVEEAAVLFLLTEKRLEAQVSKAGYVLDQYMNTLKLAPEFKRDLARRYGKEVYPTTRFNLYGKDFKTTDKWDRAGLHVHFSNQVEIVTKTCKKCATKLQTVTVAQFVNVPVIVRALDEAFKVEIKQAYRLPGWYEIKPHGFEYRSLPAHFKGGVEAVANVIKNLKGMV